jgi:hypothetical protein
MEQTFKVSISVQEAADIIYNEVVDGSITGELIDKYEIKDESTLKCMVMVFEKHYYRAGNRLTLTVVLDNLGSNTRVHYASGGGGEGLFRFDWGASEAFADIVPNTLDEYRIN